MKMDDGEELTVHQAIERQDHWPSGRGTPADWTLDALVEGTTVGFEQRLTAEDIDAFAELSGDDNPLHMDPAFARSHGFRDRVVHGALLAALASRLIGTLLPGRHALLLSLRLEFPAPTFPGDLVAVGGTVSTIHLSQRTVALRLTMQCGAEVRARGTALVLVQPELPA
jgi:3-hydroxybutyryl-CoA dehydratase